MEEVRRATWDDVISLCKLLKKHSVEYILVGGYAMYAHGFSRPTLDIDIAVNPSFQNSARWIMALSELPDGVTKELIGEEDPFNGDYTHEITILDEFQIDVMPSVCGESFNTLKQYTGILEEDDIEIPVLTLEGLHLTKQGVRPKDQSDAFVIGLAIERLRESQNSSNKLPDKKDDEEEPAP